MNKKEVTISAGRVESDFLPYVRRPSRYIGGEINQIRKDLDKCDLRIAVCFPDIYEIGMSYAGLAVIYDVLGGKGLRRSGFLRRGVTQKRYCVRKRYRYSVWNPKHL